MSKLTRALSLDRPLFPAGTPPSAPERSRRTMGVALGCFGMACGLAGAAICLVLAAPSQSDGTLAIVACAAVAVAVALVGTGLLLALRERRQHTQELRRASRIERIHHELDLLGLTPKEIPVAKLILQHQSYDDIARTLGIATRTVQFHASNIYHKAYVTRRRDFERLILADLFERNGAPHEVIARLTPENAPPECRPRAS